MLYYIMYTSIINNTKYYAYYSRKGNTNSPKWNSLVWGLAPCRQPTFMNVFKAKQITAQLRARDIERNELDWYTYTIIPVLRFTYK